MLLLLCLVTLSGFTSAMPNTSEILTSFGLPSEVHEVVTEDGYILKLFRIPRAGAKVALLDHPLSASSDIFVLLGRNKSLSCIMYDAGYDVWMTNHRGTLYGRQTVTNPDPTFYDYKFWDFSLDELALYDLPAIIDYVVNTTEQTKLYYVGHSAAPPSLFALLATKVEYNNNIQIAVTLAPAVYSVQKYRLTLFSLGLSQVTRIYDITSFFHIYEAIPRSKLFNLFYYICSIPLVCKTVIKVLLLGYDFRGPDEEFLPMQASHAVSGTSFNEILQVGRSLQPNGSNFTKYDYGVEKNRQKYGTDYPPMYNLSQVTAPVAVIYSTTDSYVDAHAIGILKENLKTIVYEHVISGPIGHVDYVFGAYAKDIVYGRVVDICSEFSG